MIQKSIAVRYFWWALPLLVGGCSTLEEYIPTGRVDYQRSAPTAGLELPPDLGNLPLEDALPVPTTGASLAAQQQPTTTASRLTPAVLQTPTDAQIKRSGDRQWLVIEQSPDNLWPKIKAFWANNGFVLRRDEPQLGIVETEWKENRADIPQDAIRRVIGMVADFAYSASTRDKYRIRIERVADNRSEIFLTHYGVEEVITGANRSPQSDGPVMWRPRPRDPELEVEMLRRLLVHLGTPEQVATTQVANATTVAARTVTRRTTVEGVNGLLIEKDYNQAWRLVGLALDGSDFVVQDQQRSEGRYTVEFFAEGAPRNAANAGGFWSNMAFWRSNQPAKGVLYWVRLADLQTQTFVVVQTPEGQTVTTDVANKLLDTIAKNLP